MSGSTATTARCACSSTTPSSARATTRRAATARAAGKGLTDVRLAYFGVGATPVRANKAEAALERGDVVAAVAPLDLDPQDDVQAHVWYSLSASSGDEQATRMRDKMEHEMTYDQIQKAKALAQTWRAKHNTQ